MKTVKAMLNIEYVDAEMPDMVQTMVWHTYDQSPEFPRLIHQINVMGNSEGFTIKNWIISQQGPLGPEPTHPLSSTMAH